VRSIGGISPIQDDGFEYLESDYSLQSGIVCSGLRFIGESCQCSYTQ